MNKLFLLPLFLCGSTLAMQESGQKEAAKPKKEHFVTLHEQAVHMLAQKAIALYDRQMQNKNGGLKNHAKAYAVILEDLQSTKNDNQNPALGIVIPVLRHIINKIGRCDIVGYHIISCSIEASKEAAENKNEKPFEELVSFFENFCAEAQMNLCRFIIEHARAGCNSTRKKLISNLAFRMKDYLVLPVALSFHTSYEDDDHQDELFKQLKKKILEPFLNRTHEKYLPVQSDPVIGLRMTALMATNGLTSESEFRQKIRAVFGEPSGDDVIAGVEYLVLNYGCRSLNHVKKIAPALSEFILPIYEINTPENQVLVRIRCVHNLYNKFVALYPRAYDLLHLGYAPLDTHAAMLDLLTFQTGTIDAHGLSKLIKQSRIIEAQEFVKEIPSKHAALESICLDLGVMLSGENGNLQPDESFSLFGNLPDAVKEKHLDEVIALFLPFFLDLKEIEGFPFFVSQIMLVHQCYNLKNNIFDALKKRLQPFIASATQEEFDMKLFEYQKEMDRAYHAQKN